MSSKYLDYNGLSYFWAKVKNFLNGKFGNNHPLMDGTASAGSSTNYSREDHVHPKDTSKVDKVVNATSGNFAGLDSNGNLTDSGIKASDFADVAFSGSYNDLDDVPNGLMYGGEITPSSPVPESVEGMLFLAFESGTYVNFGNFTLQQGFMSFVYYSNGWNHSDKPFDKVGYQMLYFNSRYIFGGIDYLYKPLYFIKIGDSLFYKSSENSDAFVFYQIPYITESVGIISFTFGMFEVSKTPTTYLGQTAYKITFTNSFLDTYTKDAIDSRIASAIEEAQIGAAMFKGVTDLVDGATVTSGHWNFPSLSDYKAGWYWVVASAGTYAGQQCEVGDTIFCINDKGVSYSASDFNALQTNIDISGKADKVSDAVSGNFAGLDSNGNLTDSGRSPSNTPRKILANDGIDNMTSTEIASLNYGDIVIDNGGSDVYTYLVTMLSEEQCCLSCNFDYYTESVWYAYDSNINAWVFYTHEYCSYASLANTPQIIITGNITTILSSSILSAKVGDIFKAFSENYTVTKKTETECYLVHTEADSIDEVKYTKTGNNWAYSQTTTTSFSSISDISNKADKVQNATNGHLAGLDATGNLTDSGHSSSDFALNSQVTTKIVVDDIMNIPPRTVDNLQVGDIVAEHIDNGDGESWAEDTYKEYVVSYRYEQSYEGVYSGSLYLDGIYPGFQVILIRVIYSRYAEEDWVCTTEKYVLSGRATNMYPNNNKYTVFTEDNATYLMNLPLTGNVSIIASSNRDIFFLSPIFFRFSFDTGNTVPNVTWPSQISYWKGGSAPTLQPNTHYEIVVYGRSLGGTSFSAFAECLSTADDTVDISGKADKVIGATNGNFAGLDSNGNLTDSGTKPSDFVTVTNLPAYTISRLGTAEAGYITSYVLLKDGVQDGSTINIPKDYLVRSGEIIDVIEYNGQYYDSTDIGHTNPLPVTSIGKYLDFTINTADSGGTEQHIYIAVDDLVDVYTAGNGIDISNSNAVSISIDSSNSNGLSTSSSGIALSTAVASSGGTGGSAGAMTATDKEKLDTIASGAEVNVQSDWNQTDNTADDYIKNKPNYASSVSFGGPATKAVSIPFGQVDSTSTSTVFTATIDGITELRDGVFMYLRNGVVSSAEGFTININGLGAKPVYQNIADGTRVNVGFKKAKTFLFAYNSTRVEGGCWDIYYGVGSAESDNNNIGYQLRTNSGTLPAKFKTYRYRLLFTSSDGNYFVGANADTTTNATAVKTPTTEKIDPFGEIVYYNSTTIVNENVNFNTTILWQQYQFTLGYSFNNTGVALVLDYPKPVYIKCAPQTDGSAIIDATTPYVQSLPSTEDGKIYIYLGIACSATAVELHMKHPVYYYKDGAIREWTNAPDGVPSGGTTGQVLTKHSDTDNDVEWATIPVPELSIDVTYNEILALKNSHSLVPGATYCITDYKCTYYNSVSDAYWNTRNGGLFIKALTDRTLSEDGELVLLANNVTVEVATGVNKTIPYKKQVCSVKYTTDNIDGLSDSTEVAVVDTAILFDPSAPQDLIELSTPPTFTYVRDTVYDAPPISIYSFEINGTTYYINGNSIASTDGSTLFSTGYSGEMEGIDLSSNSEFSGILVRDNGTYYYTMTGPTVYNTGETAEIDGDTFEIFSESLPYAIGDDCYLIDGYYFNVPGNGRCNYGHYDTMNDTWVYSSISVNQKMLRRDEEHIEYSGKGSIYHMVDDYGNEAVFDFKGRLTSSNGFYLGTTMYNYENGNYTDLDVKVDRSSTSDGLFINNILLNKDLGILDLYDVWRIDGYYMDCSCVQECKFYHTDGGISGYRQIYRTDFESGSVDDSKLGENSYISDLEFNTDSEYHTVVFKKAGAIDSLVSNIEVENADSIELTETGGQVETAYNSDYNYRIVKIPALTRISIEPNTDTSMINDYCGASCLLNGRPYYYDEDTYDYVACVFIEGDTRRYGYFKLGDWDGSSTLVFVTLQKSYLCLNVYYEQDDQDLGSNDSIFTINNGDLYVNNGYRNRTASGDYLTREKVLENALDVVSCGTTRVATSQPSGGMLPNVMYNLGTLSSDTTFSLAAASDNSVANVWSWTFSIGSTVPNLTWPSTGIIVWDDGAEPSSVANTYYEINVMNGIAVAYTIELPSI